MQNVEAMKYDKKTTFTRYGNCNHCGWCCNFVGLYPLTIEKKEGAKEKDINPDMIRYYELHGGKSSGDGKKVQIMFYLAATCKEYNIKKRGEESCNIYNERPNICKDFPIFPEQIEGTPCSYWFEYEVDGKIIKRGGQESLYPTPVHFTR